MTRVIVRDNAGNEEIIESDHWAEARRQLNEAEASKENRQAYIHEDLAKATRDEHLDMLRKKLKRIQDDTGWALALLDEFLKKAGES